MIILVFNLIQNFNIYSDLYNNAKSLSNRTNRDDELIVDLQK
jgi:hypothetical protein